MTENSNIKCESITLPAVSVYSEFTNTASHVLSVAIMYVLFKLSQKTTYVYAFTYIQLVMKYTAGETSSLYI